jgi:hypothetical protein
LLKPRRPKRKQRKRMAKKPQEYYAPEQLRGVANEAPTPSKDVLATWEEKAGVKPLSRKEAFGSFQPAEGGDVRNIPGVRTPDLTNSRSAAETQAGADADTAVAIARAPMPIPDNHLRPKIDRILGQEGHRRAYAEHEAGPGAAPEAVEAKGKEWDSITDAEKLAWQRGPGKEATNKAIAEAHAAHTTTAKTKENQFTNIRNKARELSFSNPEGYKNFVEKGDLPREGNIEEIPNIKDPVQRAALGEPRTQPESDWRKGWVGGATSRPELGLSLTSSPKHHADLAAHIADLQGRKLQGQGRSLPLGVVTRDHDGNVLQGVHSAPHLQMEQIGGGFPTANGGTVLRENQFDAKGLAARDAMESLTKSARAHSLGLKDQALQHFAAAVGHTKRLATIVNDNNRTRGANVPDFPEADLDKANDIHDDYKDSLGR